MTSSLSGTRSNQLSYTPVSFPRGAEGEVRQRKFVREVRLNFWEARPASRACHVSSGRPLRALRRIDHRELLAKPRLLRKEVIQPQVPLRLPCYDFIPITTHTLGGQMPDFGCRRLS